MRHRKIGGKFKKTVAVGLVVSMALGSATLRSFAKDVTEDTSTTSESDSSDKKESSVTSEEYSSERIATIYSNISKDYTASDYTGEPVTVSEENSSDSACTANEIIDYSKSGDFKSLGCQKSLDAMCQCLNSEKTIETILKELDALAIDYSGCATRDVNADLLFKVVEVRAASRYFDTEEEPFHLE